MAEEEMEKPVHIDLPRFTDDPTSRRWVETKVEVEKQKVTVVVFLHSEAFYEFGLIFHICI